MMMLSKEEIIKTRNWMFRNARPLELARWRYHFENGSKEEVINVLSAYQNSDGGFGNAVEADSWNPDSSPYSTSYVVGLLEEIKFNDKNHPIIEGILSYLENTPVFTGTYWPAIIKSNDDYPHAPWWTCCGGYATDWGYTPTAKLAAFIIRFADKNAGIRKKAENIASEAVYKYLDGVLPDGKPYRSVSREGEIEGFCYLLACMEESLIPDTGDSEKLKLALKEQVDVFIEKDVSKWNQYCRKPSFFITSPGSIFLSGNKEIMDAELDYIISNRNTDGSWNIPWNWGAYEREFAIAENWWKATKSFEHMLLLKNFGRLQ